MLATKLSFRLPFAMCYDEFPLLSQWDSLPIRAIKFSSRIHKSSSFKTLQMFHNMNTLNQGILPKPSPSNTRQELTTQLSRNWKGGKYHFWKSTCNIVWKKNWSTVPIQDTVIPWNKFALIRKSMVEHLLQWVSISRRQSIQTQERKLMYCNT